MARLVAVVLIIAVAASTLPCGVACHDHKRRTLLSAQQAAVIDAASARMHIGGREGLAPLGDRFEMHNPLEFLRMDRLRVERQHAVRLTANVTELRRSGCAPCPPGCTRLAPLPYTCSRPCAAFGQTCMTALCS
jgi:hypothetical protein